MDRKSGREIENEQQQKIGITIAASFLMRIIKYHVKWKLMKWLADETLQNVINWCLHYVLQPFLFSAWVQHFNLYCVPHQIANRTSCRCACALTSWQSISIGLLFDFNSFAWNKPNKMQRNCRKEMAKNNWEK